MGAVFTSASTAGTSLLFVILSESRSAFLISILGVFLQVFIRELGRSGFPRVIGRSSLVVSLSAVVWAPLFLQLGSILGAKAGLASSTVVEAMKSLVADYSWITGVLLSSLPVSMGGAK